MYLFVLASNTFPYVKKRILVVQEEQYELTPVEVRYSSIAKKTALIVVLQVTCV